jgi:hypothetical protein
MKDCGKRKNGVMQAQRRGDLSMARMHCGFVLKNKDLHCLTEKD